MIDGRLQIARGKIEDGIEQYERAVKLSAKDAGTIYADLAATLASLRDPSLDEQIEKALKSAASANPPHLDSIFELGQSYVIAGRGEGREYLQRYLDLASKLPKDQQDARQLRLAKQMIRALDLLKEK